MGSLEDRFRGEENARISADIANHNQKVDEVRRLLPAVAAYLQEHPEESINGYKGWVKYKGTPRVALRVGWYYSSADSTNDVCLIPDEQLLFITASLSSFDQAPDLREEDIVELRHAKTDRDRIVQSSHIDALFKGFNEILPKPEPRRRKRWGGSKS